MTQDDGPGEKERTLSEAQCARFAQALAHRGLTYRDLSRKTLIGESSVGAVLNGKQDAKFSNLEKIMDALCVNPGWVLAGMEPRYLDGSGGSSESGVLRAVVVTDLDRWLRTQPTGSVTPSEIEFLRTAPLPSGGKGRRDTAYQTLLQALRFAITLCQD